MDPEVDGSRPPNRTILLQDISKMAVRVHFLVKDADDPYVRLALLVEDHVALVFEAQISFGNPSCAMPGIGVQTKHRKTGIKPVEILAPLRKSELADGILVYLFDIFIRFSGRMILFHWQVQGGPQR